MAVVLFYEKPGCINNTRQKVLLAAAGHTVQARSLLTEKWTAERLRAFFGDLPVAEWFNRSSPRVYGGEVTPEALDEARALRLMVADPLLIRRPLMEVEGERRVGFDQDEVDRWIGLGSKLNGRLMTKAAREDLETCPRRQADGATPPFGKGGPEGIPSTAGLATAAKAPSIPLLQRGRKTG
jgi:nitrogenase-associated protein